MQPIKAETARLTFDLAHASGYKRVPLRSSTTCCDDRCELRRDNAFNFLGMALQRIDDLFAEQRDARTVACGDALRELGMRRDAERPRKNSVLVKFSFFTLFVLLKYPL